MPILNRYWWLQRVGGVLLAIVIVGYVAYESGLFHDFGVGGTGTLGGVSPCDFAFIILMFVGAIGVFGDSFRSHDRFRLRLAAIGGEQGAIPRFEISVDPGRAPDVSTERLELLWRATRLTRRICTTIYVTFCILSGGAWLFALYAAYLAATTKPLSPWTFDLPTVEYVVPLIAVFIACPLGVGIVTVGLPAVRGKPFGVSAGGDGITSYPKVGRSRLIRWEEMRLLEVATTDSYSQQSHAFRLYGRDAIAEWTDNPPSRVYSLGMTKDEFLERHQALLDLIAARTGLVPRTFDPPPRPRGRTDWPLWQPPPG
jgi:hypothetical protein